MLDTFKGAAPYDTPTQRWFSGDHLDGDRTNNAAENLWWATNEEQQANRGVKRVARLEPDETRQLMRPPKKAKEFVNKVQYGPPKSEIVYKHFISTSDSVDTTMTLFGYTSSGTVRNYICRHYKPSDAEIIIQKLKITQHDIRRTNDVVLESQEFTKHHKGQSSVYTPFVHAALGPNCTNHALAASLTPWLMRDVCICTEQQVEDIRPSTLIRNSLLRLFKSRRAKAITIEIEDLYNQLRCHGLTTNDAHKESWLKIIHHYVRINTLSTGSTEAFDQDNHQHMYNLDRQKVLALI